MTLIWVTLLYALVRIMRKQICSLPMAQMRRAMASSYQTEAGDHGVEVEKALLVQKRLKTLGQ